MDKTEVTRKPKKVLLGQVVSTKSDKTAVVSVERHQKDRLYRKTMKRHKRYIAHDEQNECSVGDTVEILPCRPLSARKRWRVRKIVKKAQ